MVLHIYLYIYISNIILYSINPSFRIQSRLILDLKRNQDAGPDLEKLKAAEDCHVNRKWKPGEPTVDGSKVPNNHRLDV